MKKIISFVFLIFISSFFMVLSGCMINDVAPIRDIYNFNFDKNRAVIVFGVNKSDFSGSDEIKFDQYDILNQKITGGCFFYNRVIAKIDPGREGVQYFFFDAPPGYYSPNYIAWVDGVRVKEGQEVAFFAPGGGVTYMGDIFKIKNSFGVDVAKKPDNLISKLSDKVKLLDGVLLMPKPVFVKISPSILCMP